MYLQGGKNVITHNLITALVTLSSYVAAGVMLLTFSENNGYGYFWLFLAPLLFGLYYPFSGLAKAAFRDVPITLFRAVLYFRMVVIPLLMAVSDNYSTTYYAFNEWTTEHERSVATILLLYEFAAIAGAAELCILRQKRKETYRLSVLVPEAAQQIPPLRNYTVCWLAVAVGIAGVALYPAIRQRIYLFFGSENVTYAAMTFLPTLLFLFSQIALLLVTVVLANAIKARRSDGKKAGVGLVALLALASFLYIGIRWSNNRMSIVRSMLIVLLLWGYAFPKQIKIITGGVFGVGLVAIIGVSAFKWYGDTSRNISTVGEFEMFSSLGNFTKYLQMYFNGVDSIAFGVRLYENFSVTPRIFLNDTLRNVWFLNQLIKSGDTTMLSNVYNTTVGGSYGVGYIIPMVSQTSMYLTPALAPACSVLCTVLLFKTREKMQLKSFPTYFLFLTLSVELALFQGYNYTLMVGNIANNVLLPTLVIWVSSRISFRSTAPAPAAEPVKR